MTIQGPGTVEFHVRLGNSFVEETFMVNGFKALKNSLSFTTRARARAYILYILLNYTESLMKNGKA